MKIFFSLLTVALLLVLASVVFEKMSNDQPTITSFAECEAAGYAVMESYPRQCRVPGGELFVEELDEENVVEQDLDAEVITALQDFAQNPSSDTFARVPLAAEVSLGLSDQILKTTPSNELVSPEGWILDEEIFRGYVGPFSALDILDDPQETTITIGEHPHCANSPVPAPAEVADLRRISMQPILDPETQSCIQWWTVDLFVTEDYEIVAVTLDLWEP